MKASPEDQQKAYMLGQARGILFQEALSLVVDGRLTWWEVTDLPDLEAVKAKVTERVEFSSKVARVASKRGCAEEAA